MSRHNVILSDVETASSEEYTLTSIGGRFVSDEQEQEYRRWYAGYMIPIYRLGAMTTAGALPLLVGLMWYLKPGWSVAWAAVVVAATVLPPLITQIILIKIRKREAAVTGAAVLGGATGLATVLTLDLILQLPIVATMLIIFSFSYLIPLRPTHNLVVMPLIAILHIGCSAHTYNVGALSATGLATVLFFTTSCTTMMIAGVWSFHRFIRKSFVQQQVISAQAIAIEREKDRADRLLLNILPAPIAERLKREPGQIAEQHDEVTILFCDIVGFTPLSEKLSAGELVTLLDRIVSRFDALAAQHGIEKIKTIGDAYMAVAGLSERRDDHAEAAAQMALEMPAVVSEIGAELCPELDPPLTVRVGLYSGPVVAGVIGSKKFAYDLWGDSVNVAARMESHGVEGQVQIGATTHALLCSNDSQRFSFTERGAIEVKGKGQMNAWLIDNRPSA